MVSVASAMSVPLLHGPAACSRRAGSGWKASRLPAPVKVGTEPSCLAIPAAPIVPSLTLDGNNFLAAQHQIH
jgi:hypothetical protein